MVEEKGSIEYFNDDLVKSAEAGNEGEEKYVVKRIVAKKREQSQSM